MSQPLYYSGATLRRCPPLRAGEQITCPGCGAQHVVRPLGQTFGPQEEEPPPLVYTCRGETLLAGIGGRSVIGVEPDGRGDEGLRAWKREDADA